MTFHLELLPPEFISPMRFSIVILVLRGVSLELVFII